MSLTTEQIESAFKGMRSALPGMTVQALHVASGRVLSVVRSSNQNDSSAAAAGLSLGVRMRIRAVVSEMGGAEVADGDKMVITANQTDVTYRVLNRRPDPSGATMLIEMGDEYGAAGA
jgi:hypothetical protein